MKRVTRPRLRSLLANRRGAAALEFALVMLAFLPLCLGTMEAGLLLWAHNALQTSANLTARCVAISSPACSNAAQFAVTTANIWLQPGILTTAGVTVQTGASCTGASGTMVKVTLTSTGFSSMPLVSQLATSALTTSACYPASP